MKQVESALPRSAPTVVYMGTMANEPVNPHDAFLEQYLSRPQVASDFLRRQLPKNQVMPK